MPPVPVDEEPAVVEAAEGEEETELLPPIAVKRPKLTVRIEETARRERLLDAWCKLLVLVPFLTRLVLSEDEDKVVE